MRRLRPRNWSLTAVCVLVSAHFSIAYVTMTHPMVAFPPYAQLDGKNGPFAYRMLPALLWKACLFLFHPIHQYFPHARLPHLNPPFSSNEDWFVTLLTFFSMLGTLSISRRLLRAIDSRRAFEWLALAMAYAAYFDLILVLNRNLYYPYDLTALFFFTALTFLAYQGRARWFAAVLICAMVNKETAIMAIPVYFGLQYGRRPHKRLFALCAIFSILALATRLGQWAYLRSLCSGCSHQMENHLSGNLHQFGNPLFWVSILSTFGFAYVASFFLWRYIPAHVRRTVIVVFLLWSAAMLYAGILREVRIFSELSALLFLANALGLHHWLAKRSPRDIRQVG